MAKIGEIIISGTVTIPAGGIMIKNQRENVLTQIFKREITAR
jgi:hypothetical protein